jgi:hypothetical protein
MRQFVEKRVPSPFPGMDPYLEDPAYRSDFHHRFIDDLSDAITARLPGNYFAKIDEHVVIIDPELDNPRLVIPDVSVARDPRREPGGAAVVADLDLEPEIMTNVLHLDPTTQAFIEIRRMPERNLITVVELLSPVNKNGAQGQYLDKRQLLLRKKVPIVEIDLLRGGRRLSLNKPLPDGHYFGFVSRFEPKSVCEVYHWTVRRRLPKLPVPLRLEDGDIRVDLQEVFGITFERGRYSKMIDYKKTPPGPAFFGDDMEWVAERARTAEN